jgi:hypothetical protein
LEVSIYCQRIFMGRRLAAGRDGNISQEGQFYLLSTMRGARIESF